MSRFFFLLDDYKRFYNFSRNEIAICILLTHGCICFPHILFGVFIFIFGLVIIWPNTIYYRYMANTRTHTHTQQTCVPHNNQQRFLLLRALCCCCCCYQDMCTIALKSSAQIKKWNRCIVRRNNKEIRSKFVSISLFCWSGFLWNQAILFIYCFFLSRFIFFRFSLRRLSCFDYSSNQNENPASCVYVLLILTTQQSINNDNIK